MPIKPYKNDGTSGSRKPTFRIRWSVAKGKWVKDPNGPYLGYYSDGVMTKVNEDKRSSSSISTPKVITGTPALGVFDDQ